MFVPTVAKAPSFPTELYALPCNLLKSFNDSSPPTDASEEELAKED